MALYAELDNEQRVLRVIVADNIDWPRERLGGTWVETGPTTPEEQGAGPGLYDSEDVAPRRFIPPWTQPTHAENAYDQGEWRWHNGRAWRSLLDANVWEPGVSGWREMLVAWPEYVQPTGAHDAYQVGERITFGGGRYTSAIDNNVWSPAAHPLGWEFVDGEPLPDPEPEIPAWAAGQVVAVGDLRTHNGKTWRAKVAHTTHDGWEPSEFTHAVWEEVQQ